MRSSLWVFFARVRDGLMLDDPGDALQPLLLERIEADSCPGWCSRGWGPLTMQSLQVLDVEQLPADVPLLEGIRRPQADDLQNAEFLNLLRAWRVDRTVLRLQPLPPDRVRVANPAANWP